VESYKKQHYCTIVPPQPLIDLSILRDIGWREWDPIELRKLEGGWEGSSAADEYDDYLLHVATCLQSDGVESDLVDYLIGIETEHMGLDPSSTTRSRARATITAIRDYVEGRAREA